MVNEAISLGQRVVNILCVEKCLDKIDARGIDVQVVSEEVYASITDEKNPQGALAVIEKPQTKMRSPNGSCILLDGIADPGNLGTIIRTMACAGYSDLYLTKECADPFAPKTVRSSMSGIYHVNVIVGEKEEILKTVNLPLVIADMKGENIFEKKFGLDKFCLVIGNEARGVSQEVRELATVTVKIPMRQGMESLNASVSAGILMYALKNQ